MDDKQFNDAFKSAGGWFVANYYLLAERWCGSSSELAEVIFKNDKTDSDIQGTKTRVNSLFRIIENGRGVEALKKVVESNKIEKLHPESKIIAKNILKSLIYSSLK